MKTLLTAHLFHALINKIIEEGEIKKCTLWNHPKTLSAVIFEQERYFVISHADEKDVQKWLSGPQ